tara:strand:- start:180 stop:542 length:363 start_codon:yes stop_codon:yes gene_type:complete
VNESDNEDLGEKQSAAPSQSKVQALKDELERLQLENSGVAQKFEASNTGQGCLGLAIITFSTLVGVIVGFGFLSVLTGIGGFIIGVGLTGMVTRDKPEKVEYLQRKSRIQEIETTLSQLG